MDVEGRGASTQSKEHVLTLQDAVESLYEIAVLRGRSQSTGRLASLARFCLQELTQRGLADAVTEGLVLGGGRTKQWDVVWRVHGRARLAISLKSILKNLPGTLPNRLDDLMGEVANAQLGSPEIVLGYIMILDISADQPRKDGLTWAEFLRDRLRELSGRGGPHWTIGTLEEARLVTVDFSRGPEIVQGADDLSSMFDRLSEATRQRNPGAAND